MQETRGRQAGEREHTSSSVRDMSARGRLCKDETQVEAASGKHKYKNGKKVKGLCLSFCALVCHEN